MLFFDLEINYTNFSNNYLTALLKNNIIATVTMNLN